MLSGLNFIYHLNRFLALGSIDTISKVSPARDVRDRTHKCIRVYKKSARAQSHVYRHTRLLCIGPERSHIREKIKKDFGLF